VELSDIRTEVRERIGELSADFWTDDEVDRAINEAIRRFCIEEQWPFLLTEWDSSVTNGDDELDLPSNISLMRVFNISISGTTLVWPRMLIRVDPNEGFALRHQYTDHEGSPRWYYITRSDLSVTEAPPITYTARLIPTPDADFDVSAQYMAVPSVLGAPTDEPMVPDEYQEAVIAWAAGKLYLKEMQTSQKSSEQFGIYAKVLDQARKDLKSFSLDETVAWGRKQPLRGYWAEEWDPRFRVPPTLGG
jgi:hypothetical protein